MHPHFAQILETDRFWAAREHVPLLVGQLRIHVGLSILAVKVEELLPMSAAILIAPLVDDLLPEIVDGT